MTQVVCECGAELITLGDMQQQCSATLSKFTALHGHEYVPALRYSEIKENASDRTHQAGRNGP